MTMHSMHGTFCRAIDPVFRELALAGSRSASREIVQIDVEAPRIVDLREDAAVERMGIDLADAIAPWQEGVALGGTPRSWLVRDRLIAGGADGLIDRSRKRPGLWHLVLFRWNEADAPTVELVEGASAAAA